MVENTPTKISSDVLLVQMFIIIHQENRGCAPAVADNGCHDNIIRRWSVGARPASLSMTSNSNVLVTCPWVNEVREFSAFGMRVRRLTINVGVSMTTIGHVVEMSTSQFLVCYSSSSPVRRSSGQNQKLLSHSPGGDTQCGGLVLIHSKTGKLIQSCR